MFRALRRAFGSQPKMTQDDLVDHLAVRGAVRTPRVAAVMRMVDRQHFLPPRMIQHAYEDRPQPIGQGQTISAPHMHAACLELLQEQMHEGARALDVGSGSGYLTACMALMVGPSGYVLGIEKYPELAKQSVDNIKCANPELSLPRSSPDTPTTPTSPTSPGSSPTLSPPTPASPPEPSAGASVAGSHSGGGRGGVTVLGRGLNWEIVHGNALSEALRDEAPFSAIHVGAAAEELPKQLLHVLKPGGRMVVPVGRRWESQVLTVVDKDLSGRLTMQQVMGVQYVPLTRPTEMEDEMETWGPVPSQVPGKDEI